MADSLPFISVIVPVYNDTERLGRCLSALAAQTYPREHFEVIVVDNGSGEPPREIVESHSDWSFLEERQPGSYAARNRGLTAARGDIYAFTDSDCLPDPKWIAAGQRALAENPELGFVGGQVEIFPANRQQPTSVELYDMVFGLRQESNVGMWRFAATANMFTRRTTMEAVGPFSATLKSGGDLEWGQRASEAGYRGAYVEQALVRHPARESLAQIVRQARRHVGGHFDRRLNSSRRFAIGRFFKSLYRRLIPSVGNMRLARTRLRSLGFGTREWIRVLGLIVILQYARTWESVWRRLGSGSERK